MISRFVHSSQHRGLLCRWLSSPPKKAPRILTPAEVKSEMERVEKHKKFVQATPFPKTFLAGAENDLYVPEDRTEVRVLSGMPKAHQERTVHIRSRTLSTMQSGEKYAHQWQISWQASEQWTNPLTGWTSSADPHSTMKLTFDNKEDAIAYAAKNGWQYVVSEPVTTQTVEAGEKQYAHNFLSPRTQEVVAREGLKCKEFENPEYGASHWFMPLTYHGEREVEQHGPRSSSESATKKK